MCCVAANRSGASVRPSLLCIYILRCIFYFYEMSSFVCTTLSPASMQCRDARIRGSTAPFAVPSIARRGGKMPAGSRPRWISSFKECEKNRSKQWSGEHEDRHSPQSKKKSRPVSRVLSLNSHSSRPCVAARLEQPTREQRGPRQCSPIWSCSEWGLPCHAALSPRAVRSYRTVSPLPRIPPPLCCSASFWIRTWTSSAARSTSSPHQILSQQHRGDGIVRRFILCCTSPSAHAAQVLPGTLPCGARTFLEALACLATVWPTPQVL